MKYSITELTFDDFMIATDALENGRSDLEVGPTSPLDEPPRHDTTTEANADRAFALAGWKDGKMGTQMSVEALPGKKGFFINTRPPLKQATTDGRPLDTGTRKNIPKGRTLKEAVDAFIEVNS